ncbi:MAG: hypothetical protein ACKO8O_07175, partial [Betaproteobacteria bacterium]
WVANTSSPDWQWVATQSPRAWTSVALSANGRVIAAAAQGKTGGIWVSEDSGASWRMVLETGTRAWRSVALSADGSQLIAAADGEGVFSARLAVAGASLATRVAVEAEAGSVSVVGVNGLTLEVRDATVKVNLADKSTGRVIDFAAGDVNVTTGTDRSRTMTIDGTDQEMLSVTAGFTIAIGDYVYLDGSAGFEKRTSTVTIGDGTRVKVDSLAIGAADINAFAGLNGPYRIDADTVNTEAVGVSMTEVNVGLGLFSAQPGQKDSAGKSLNGVRWTALTAQAGAVELVGIPDVTLAARSFQVEINRVSGLPAGVDADQRVINFAGSKAYPIRTGTGSTIDLAMSSELGQLLRVSGDVDVSVAGMLSLSGGIQLEQYQRMVTLTDATDEQQVIEVMTGAASGANWYRMVIEIDGARYLTRDIHVTETAQQIENAINAAIDTVPGAQVSVATEADGDRPVVRFGGSLAGTDIKPIKLVVPSYGAAWAAAGTVTTQVEGGETQEVLARILVLAGAGINARIATGSGDEAVGLELTDLDFALAFADSVDDDRSFLALKGSAASLGVVGLERYGLALMGSNLAVNLNLGFGDDPQGGRNTNTINWETSKLTLKPGTGTPITLDFTEEVLEVGGSMLVRVGDFLRVEGSVVVSRKTLDVTVAGRTEFVQAFLIGASDVSAQVQGIAVEGLNLAAALMRPLDGPDFDKRAWLAVRAEVDAVSVSAEMLGLPAELFTLEANSLLFETNRAIGSRAGVANDAVVDFSVTEVDGETIDRSIAVKTNLATDATVSLDYSVDAGQFTTLTLDAALSIADYVTASGSFALSMLGGRTVTLSDGQRRSMRTTLIAARNVDVRLGVNAGSEEDFIGVSLTGGSLGLALLSDVRGGGSFVGLHAGAQNVALQGVPGLTLGAGGLDLSLNLGPTTGELAGLTADFTQGDIDGDGLSGSTALRMRGEIVDSLDSRLRTLAAAGSVALQVRAPDAAAGSAPIVSARADLSLEVVPGGALLIGASGLEATVSLAGQTAGIIDGRLGVVVPLSAPALTASPGESPAGEGVSGINDAKPATKYLNKAGPTSGFTVALPQAKPMNAMLLVSRTNDDIWQWDPKTWEVWGSNNSVDWGDTDWVKLGEGDTGLANARGSSSVVSFANDTPYRFYKVVFPTIKDFYQGKAYLHLAEARLFEMQSGGLTSTPGQSPANEMVENALDGDPATKYLNQTGPGSGYTLSLDAPQVFDSLALTTRTNDDIWQWDPKTWEVWASNGSLSWPGAAVATTSGWTRLGAGNTGLANSRGAASVVTFNNQTAYTHYTVVFPTVKGSFEGNTYMHIADARLFAQPPAAATGTLPGEGFAFVLDATAKVPIPFINESLFGGGIEHEGKAFARQRPGGGRGRLRKQPRIRNMHV